MVFTVGADQELAETSGSPRERMVRTSDEAKDENDGHSDASSACQKTHTAADDDDDDDDDDNNMHIKAEDSGDAVVSAAQTLLENAKDSAGGIADEEADEDFIGDDDGDDDKEQVRSLSRPVNSVVILSR